MPIVEGRNWDERAFTIGIGGYVQISEDQVYRECSCLTRPRYQTCRIRKDRVDARAVSEVTWRVQHCCSDK
jgi:hypothetical protein